MKYLLRAPATSANLGPGFDCLGLAVDLWNEVEVETLPGSGRLVVQMEGEGAGQLPADESHLMFQVAFEYLRQAGRPDWPSLRVACLNRIPLARGLGSSAATRVLGVMLGQLLADRQDSNEVFAWASRLEGHPDNVAPAVFGGLASSLSQPDGSYHSQEWPLHADLRLVVAIPHFTLETKQSRAVLPPHYTRNEAVFNLARLPWLLRGLGEGRSDWLALGSEDRWHQEQRGALIPGMHQVFLAARQAGAAACYLSGAGPTLAAWVDVRVSDPQKVAQAMEDAWFGRCRSRVLQPSARGAFVQT